MAVRKEAFTKAPEGAVLPHNTDWKNLQLIVPKEGHPVPRMRILLNGQGAFGRNVYDALVADGHEIVGVIATMVRGRNNSMDPLREQAIQDGVPIIKLASIDDPKTQKGIRMLKAEIGVMAFVTKTVPPEVSKAPRFGTIQFHPGNEHGRSSQNWAIIDGYETEKVNILAVEDTGKPDEIDTGRVALQPQVEIPEDITMSEMYDSAMSPLGVVALRDAVRERAYAIAKGRRLKEKINIPLRPQGGSLKPGRPPIAREDVRVHPKKMTALAMHNMIRGAQNSPAAYLQERNGAQVNLYDSQKVMGPVRKEDVGTYSIAGDNLQITTKQGLVSVGRLRRIHGEQKGGFENAAKYAEEHPLPGLKRQDIH